MNWTDAFCAVLAAPPLAGLFFLFIFTCWWRAGQQAIAKRDEERRIDNENLRAWRQYHRWRKHNDPIEEEDPPPF